MSKNNYGADKISVLKGLEAVRKTHWRAILISFVLLMKTI